MFILCKISRSLYSASLAWNCLFTPLLGSFWGILPPNEFRYCCNHHKDRPWVKTGHVSHKLWKSVHGFDLEVCPRKIQYNQPTKQLGKSYKTVIFHLSGEKPCWTGWNENLHWSRPRRRNHGHQVQSWKDFSHSDVIMGQSSPLPIDFARGPYHYRAACDK